MKVLCQKYMDNLAAVGRLIKPQLDQDMNEEQALEAIRSQAGELYQIHQENDKILQEILFSKQPDTLTAEEAAELSELADRLFNFDRSPDTGIAYKIHQLLYAYAEEHHDIDLMIRELYYQGITVLYLNTRDPSQGVNVFLHQIGEYFEKGASYLEQYEEIENTTTRSFILRCLGNTKYGLEKFQGGNDGEDRGNINTSWNDYMKCFEKAMAVFESPHYRQLDSGIPWDTFVYTMHYDRTQFLTGLRNEEQPAIAQGVLESAEHVYRHQEQIAKAGEKGVGARTRYVYIAARYHAGAASAGELMETLEDMYEKARDDDFTGDNIWVMMYVPEYLRFYCNFLPEEERAQWQSRMTEIYTRQKKYLFRLPKSEYGLQVARIMRHITVNLSERDFHEILHYILACHPPTYVHSTMVAMLTRRFCEQMAKVKPEQLEGSFGYESAEEILENLGTVLELAYQGGLYHDLGKCMLLNYVGLYSRRLLDEEFACIKMHPKFGYTLLESLQMDDMAKIAYYHHLSYNRGGGYPHLEEECPVRVRCIADIVTVVDALEAGTDNVGRSYAASKTYEQLVGELQTGKGTRYAPAVVELLDDADFFHGTKAFIEDNRKRVYLDVYRIGE